MAFCDVTWKPISAREKHYSLVWYTCILRVLAGRVSVNQLPAKSPLALWTRNFLYELFQWYSHANKIQLHKKAFAFSLVLKVRVFVTQKWPIAGKQKKVGQQRTKNTTAKRLRMLRVEHFRSNLRSHFPGKVSRARLHSLCSMRFVVLLHLVSLTILLFWNCFYG